MDATAPFPNEVTARLRPAQTPTVRGNYDNGVGFERDDCGCAYREADDKRRGDQSLAWTKAHVTEDNKGLPRTLHHDIRFEADGKRVLLVHGSPRKISEYLFEDTVMNILAVLGLIVIVAIVIALWRIKRPPPPPPAS